MNGLDLFSGIGGLSLALEPFVRPVAYCENDRYAQAVLLSRMGCGQLHLAPIWDDVRTLRGSELPRVDIIYGGFPCQDISVAGRGKGLAGERSGLFVHVARLAEEIRPAFIFLENVPAIRTRGLSVVCEQLASLGFDLRWTTVSAAEVGALHRRRRWFLLAHAIDKGRWHDAWQTEPTDTNGQALRVKPAGRSGTGRRPSAFDPSAGESWLSAWASQGGFEPRVSRTGNGIPFAVDRDRALGNAVVPLQARVAFERLLGLK